jgi:hypothetical protein
MTTVWPGEGCDGELSSTTVPLTAIGAETVTAAVAVLLPLEPVAVSVKVVAAVTWTVVLPVVTGVTEPTFWLMESAVAPVTFQASVTVPPAVGRLLGVAVKVVMVGPLPPLEHAASPTNDAKTRALVATIRYLLPG